MTFPGLYKGPKPQTVIQAYEVIYTTYKHAFDLLRSEAPDGLRLKVNADKLESTVMPLVVELRRMVEVPRPWIASMAETVRELEGALREAAEQLQGMGREREGSVYAILAPASLTRFIQRISTTVLSCQDCLSR